MRIPPTVSGLLGRLREHGYAAYAVGGCVRDTLLGIEPKDWDICTSALPEEMKQVFEEYRTADTGLKHGTLTVIVDRVPYEITTFRIDGAYTDHRHPDHVCFVDRVDEDLARRDFTVNAMACDDEDRIVDLFGGQADLEKRIIRCVGDPGKRFEEDALRILRALRFASVYGFTVEEKTADAIRKYVGTLSNVAGERIREELMKLLCGKDCGRILRAFPEVFCLIVPELKATVGFEQNNPHHLYDVWEHTVRGVENVEAEPLLRMTMLLHDTGKPLTMTTDEKGCSHYCGHPVESAKIAAKTAERLKLDRVTTHDLLTLVEAHDIPLSTERKILLRRLRKFGEKNLRRLFVIHRADRIATGTRTETEKDEDTRALIKALDDLLAEEPCYSLKQLAVTGTDLLQLGMKGPEIGQTLDGLLNAVIDGKAENTRENLLDLAGKRIKRPESDKGGQEHG